MIDASDVLVERLLAWRIDTIFGLPGDGISGVIEALRKQKDKIRFIHFRHEEAAAFMACAYAKFTGRLSVCIATSGPGGIHLLNGLYDAKPRLVRAADGRLPVCPTSTPATENQNLRPLLRYSSVARDCAIGCGLELGKHRIRGWRYADAIQKDQCRTDRRRR
jgi:hypothetical protein